MIMAMPQSVTTRSVDRPKASVYSRIRTNAEMSMMPVSRDVTAHSTRTARFSRNRVSAGRMMLSVSNATATS